MPSPRSSTAVLLGAQRFQPSLGAVVAEIGVKGRIAVITAGWQEREPEDDDLSEHLEGRTVNLALHARGDALFRVDAELHAAHRERQDTMRHLQDFYRIRLSHALEAERVVRAHAAPPAIRAEVEEATIEAIRDLDAWHLDQCARIRAAFDERWRLHKRPSVQRQREQIGKLIDECAAVAIAGGHVATLINRLLLFGIEELVGERAVFAWSGGAMAVSDRVVLFHDDPPQGPSACEVLDVGLGIVPGVVVLPQPEQRLRLDDEDGLSLLARRFAPAKCLAFPARAHVTWRRRGLTRADGVISISTDGKATPFVTGGGR